MTRLLSLLLCLALLLAAPASAAVAKNAGDSGTPQVATGFGSGATSLSHTGYTIGAGSDIYLIAIIGLANATPSDVSNVAITWNSVSMTRLGTGIYNDVRVELFYLASPATGNHTAAATWTTGADAVLGLISFTGAATPIDFATNSGSANPISTGAITADAAGATVGAGGQRSNLTSPSGGTSLYVDNTNWAASGVSYAVGSASSDTYTWQVAPGNWSAAGAHIPAASAGGGGGSPPNGLSLLGAGR